MKNRKSLLAVLLVVLIAAVVAFWLMTRPAPRMSAMIDSMNGNHYSLELPSTMRSAVFNETASLQYADPKAELYVMVIDESKDKIASFGLDYDLETYMKIALRTLDSAGLYPTSMRTIGNCKALQAEVKTNFKGQPVVYQLTTLESETSFYQLLIWSLESRYEMNKQEMESITNSFRETNKTGEKQDDQPNSPRK